MSTTLMISHGGLSVVLFLLLQVMCRCSTPLDNSVKEKISMFCHVEPEQVSLDAPGANRTNITVELM